MNSYRTRRSVFFLTLLWAVTSCSTATTTARTTEFSSFRFPNQLANFIRGDLHRYPSPELGASVPYTHEREAITLTLYVYNGGEGKIPSGPGPAAEAQLKSATINVATLVRMKRYKSARVLGRKVVPFGEPPRKMLRTLLRIEIGGGVSESQIIVTGWKGQFFKVRASYPSHLSRPARGSIHQFLDAFVIANH